MSDKLAEITARWSSDSFQHGEYGIAQYDIAYLLRLVTAQAKVVEAAEEAIDHIEGCCGQVDSKWTQALTHLRTVQDTT